MNRIYIAGPYTEGDVARNVKAAIDAANELIELGFAPYVPHLSHFLHMAHPQPYGIWMGLDMVWQSQCHAVLRLPGPSSGADTETRTAKIVGMPVFHSISELVEAMK